MRSTRRERAGIDDQHEDFQCGESVHLALHRKEPYPFLRLLPRNGIDSSSVRNRQMKPVAPVFLRERWAGHGMIRSRRKSENIRRNISSVSTRSWNPKRRALLVSETIS